MLIWKVKEYAVNYFGETEMRTHLRTYERFRMYKHKLFNAVNSEFSYSNRKMTEIYPTGYTAMKMEMHAIDWKGTWNFFRLPHVFIEGVQAKKFKIDYIGGAN